MSPDKVFEIINTAVLPFWGVLIFAPNWKWKNPAIYIGVSILAIVYLSYLFTGPMLDFSAFGSLAGVKALFTADNAILIGWVHYLAFDLLTGNWIVNQAKENNISHWFIIPCLLFCFMLGPVGFLLFYIIRSIKLGGIS